MNDRVSIALLNGAVIGVIISTLGFDIVSHPYKTMILIFCFKLLTINWTSARRINGDDSKTKE